MIKLSFAKNQNSVPMFHNFTMSKDHNRKGLLINECKTSRKPSKCHQSEYLHIKLLLNGNRAYAVPSFTHRHSSHLVHNLRTRDATPKWLPFPRCTANTSSIGCTILLCKHHCQVCTYDRDPGVTGS